MSPVVEAPQRTPRPAPADRRRGFALKGLADAGLIAAFLALTFLLGVFPLKDTDFWWHLREGDLIRQTGKLPAVDDFTFGAAGHRWIDLHWIFQVLLSVGYEHVGVAGLNLAKCLLTCLAVGLLITARKEEWPAWVMVLAWLPALLVLAGRMYIRPETLTLVYLASFLAILFRIEERPGLAFLLPIIQVAWVNSQGLFVLGPAVLACALIDAAFRPGSFDQDRRGWWTKVLIATGLTGLACLANPYFLAGALYPLQLAGTMNDPIFSKTIGELEPLDSFIRKTRLANVPLLIHLGTMILGLLSFIVPICWRVWNRSRRPMPAPGAVAPRKKERKRSTKKGRAPVDDSIRPSVFRFLILVAFSALSWKASRNSHQFATVVGAVTAWNFGEWAAEMARRRAERGGIGPSARGRAGAFVVVACLFVATASGALYDWEGEGRTIGLGEEPHWFPHAAVDFAGRPDMPMRSICFHNGHAALYEYKYAPGRRTFADARLEVVGPEVYNQYIDIEKRIGRNDLPGWQDKLEEMGRPVVLTDNVHAYSAATTASLLASRMYQCVWFDEVAALFVHKSYTGAVEGHPFDFAAWHFGEGARAAATDAKAEAMLAKTCWNLIFSLDPRVGNPARLGWRLIQLKILRAGLDHAREVQRLDPSSPDGWKWAGMLEVYRELAAADEPIPRFRMTFDPVFDLSSVRASHDLRQALELSPRDGNALVALASLDLERGMFEPAVGLFDRFLARRATQENERSTQQNVSARRSMVATRMGSPPASLAWANRSELDRLLAALYQQGRVAEAAGLLESAYPPEGRPWEVSDRLATIRLHLGEPDRAIALWEAAKAPPGEAVRAARIAAALLARGSFAPARASYAVALKAEPGLFEAQFGLAVLEADAGHAADALAAARAAEKTAPHSAAKSAVQRLIEAVTPFAGP